MMATTVAVMAKSPQAGRVKTRLCPPCSPAQAARLAEASLADTLATVARTDDVRPVVVLAGPPGPWLPAEVEVVPQRDGDLSDRLAGAVEDLGGPVVIIGMDTPQVGEHDLAAVIEALRAPGIDAVLGPAEDGGYWAIGLEEPLRHAFDGVAMSVADTHRQQAERLRQLGLRIATVATMRDVDTFEDATAVAGLCHRGGFAAVVRDVSAELAESLSD